MALALNNPRKLINKNIGAPCFPKIESFSYNVLETNSKLQQISKEAVSPSSETDGRSEERKRCKADAPGPVLDFGPERGPGKGTMADLGALIRHLVSTRLSSGGRAAFLSPLSPLDGTRPCV